MRFGTFYFFQAVPWLSHEEVVHRELEQMEWTEELGFDQIWLTEHHFIDYGLAVDPGTLAAVAASRTRRVRIGLAAAESRQRPTTGIQWKHSRTESNAPFLSVYYGLLFFCHVKSYFEMCLSC